MFNWFKRRKPVVISRNELRVLISRQCGNQDFVPLDMTYTLIPSHRWLISRTPLFSPRMKDCNKRACKTMSNMLSHCVGMCILGTDEPRIDHCVMLVCMEDKAMMLYDPSLQTLASPKYYHIKRIWL